MSERSARDCPTCTTTGHTERQDGGGDALLTAACAVIPSEDPALTDVVIVDFFQPLAVSLKTSEATLTTLSMVRPPFSLTALVALLLPLATAQDDPNTWVSPTPNDGDHSHIEGTFSVGSIIKLEWQTNFTEINLVIWQDENSTLQYLPNSGIAHPFRSRMRSC